MLVAIVTLGSCTGGSPQAGPRSGRISIAYLQKQGDQQYFQDEAAGARARASELGVDLEVVDVGTDAGRTLDAARAAAARGVSGLIVTVPDPVLGPQLVEIAHKSRVELLASDDQMCADLPDPSVCAHQKLVPRVGFSGAAMGEAVGRRAAEEYLKAGWQPEQTRIVAAGRTDLSVCRERMDAAKLAFLQEAGQVRTLDIATDNTPEGARKVVASATAAEAGSPRHWVVWGCNDENVQGALAALRAAGVAEPNVIGVGLGAYLACKGWESGAPFAMRAALAIKGRDVGALAVQTMYERLRDSKPFPAEALAPTVMADPATWRTAGITCT
ncbi:substrate-binding domain-containing protein [Streptomyces sp. NRRL B-24484]|uniref:substrate-binding domain-containing protein n=1 Tax=Streptomyces sp. NRRL B-24484 TaxID=1463833 RepID=UPI000AD2007E|nr:substrate-binding domain-containing protein [Streptomyces sp. NRRL B-24484]